MRRRRRGAIKPSIHESSSHIQTHRYERTHNTRAGFFSMDFPATQIGGGGGHTHTHTHAQ
jgi:hypothetical protein